MILVHLIRNEHMNVSRIFSFAVGIFAVTQLAAQSPSPTTLIKAGRLLDPRSGNVLSPAAVLIENGKIKEVGPPPKVLTHAPGDVKTIDLGSATLLPGLIDGHTHLFLDIVRPPDAEAQRHENGIFAPGLLLALWNLLPSALCWAHRWLAKILRAALRLFATSVTLALMVILNCVTRSKLAASPVQGFWLLDASSSREVNTFRISTPPLRTQSFSRSFC